MPPKETTVVIVAEGSGEQELSVVRTQYGEVKLGRESQTQTQRLTPRHAIDL